MPNFDGKIFNQEVFGRYKDKVPSLRKNALLKAGVLRERNDLKPLFAEQTGGNYITVPMWGRLTGDEQNYDGVTDFVPTTTETYSQSMVVVGRGKAWQERDFTTEITGVDPWQGRAVDVTEWEDEKMQDTLVSILNGTFLSGDADYIMNHSTDISGESSTAAYVSATTLNSAMQKACGDNKDAFTVVIANSAVITNLENANITEYLKYKDMNAVEQYSNLVAWGNRIVLPDDSLPVSTTVTNAGTAGVYTLTVSTALASGDKIKITAGSTGEVEYAYDSGATTASAQATAIAALFASDKIFTVAADSSAVTFTQKTKGFGSAPVVDTTDSTTGAASVATTTSGAAPTYAKVYTTYVLGTGAFDFVDCGVKVPYEMDRDPLKYGGLDYLVTRNRRVYAPYGFTFTKATMAKLSPTNEELATGANWDLVKSASGVKINHRAIPIARIISKG